jgi:predicted thioesterase
MAIELSHLKPGLTGSAELLVGVEHTAPSIGSGLVPVLGTPVMINVIEAAALAAVESLLPGGHQSLGIHLDVRHFAATPVGMRVRAIAEHAHVPGRGPRRQGGDRRRFPSACRRQRGALRRTREEEERRITRPCWPGRPHPDYRRATQLLPIFTYDRLTAAHAMR